MVNVNNNTFRYILFRLGESRYALDINLMEEVLNLQEIVEIPDAPTYVKGVFRFGTTAIPVISLKEKLGLKECEGRKKPRIMVVKHCGENIGILIDELIGILDKSEKDIGKDSNAEILDLKNVLEFKA